jgi:signal peptidase I
VAVEYAHMNPSDSNVDGGTPEKEIVFPARSEMRPVGRAPFTQTTSKNTSDRSWIGYAIVALGLAIVIRFFVAAPYVVQGSSMEPNFYDWHYLIVDRITYDFSQPQRGDIIVLDLPQDTNRALIKRVIGLPGDTVELSGTKPTVTVTNPEHPEGFVLDEPYIDASNYGGASNMRITLGKDQYYVLGDNRRVSADSRLWGILPRSDIVGRVFVRLYPLNDIGFFPAKAYFQE